MFSCEHFDCFGIVSIVEFQSQVRTEERVYEHRDKAARASFPSTQGARTKPLQTSKSGNSCHATRRNPHDGSDAFNPRQVIM
jgi:hypothetical protein